MHASYSMVALVLTAQAVVADGSVWRPALDTSWQWQLSGTLDLSVDADMFDVDLFTTRAEDVATLHAKGTRAVCYMSAGTFEPYRPDSAAFPEIVKGRAVQGWPDEKWLDIRRLDVLGPIMESRLDLCKAKGFDAVEPDNVDGYSNKSGFPLSGDDQLKYNRFIAAAAHARGLSVGLKNDIDQVKLLVADFDWTLNEQCFEYRECSALTLFIAAGKPVFNVEYDVPTSTFCGAANDSNFNSMRKRLELDAYREPCRARPSPALTSIVNAASFAGGGFAPGEIVLITGLGFGPVDTVNPPPGETSTELAGTSVTFDEFPATLLSVNATQASAIVPAQTAGRDQATVRLNRSGQEVASATLTVLPAHPGLFTADFSGKGQLMATLEDGSLNSPANPASRGSVVTLLGTGFVAGAVTAVIGGLDAEVVSAAPAQSGAAGMFQIAIRVPADAPTGDRVTVVLGGDSGSAQPNVVIAVMP